MKIPGYVYWGIGSMASMVAIYFLVGQPSDPLVWWVIGIGLFGLVDAVTTGIWTNRENLTEGNPINIYLFGPSPSIKSMLLTKILGLGAAGLIYISLPENSYRVVIPVALTGFGIAVVGNNLLKRMEWV